MTQAAVTMAGRTVEQVYEDPKVISLINAAIEGKADDVKKLAASGVDVNAVGQDGSLPLFWALKSLNTAGVESLLKARADIEKVTPQFSPLSPMALVSGGDNIEFLRLLLRYGGDAKGIKSTSIDGNPLYLAATEGRSENVKLLLDAGADVNVHDEYGSSAAEGAATTGNFEVVFWLLEHGYNYDLQNLAKIVNVIKAYPNPDGAQWKSKVIDKLKAKGVN
ncbi:ankyrin repeat domain-containing protein [Pseudomonas tolaasii]|uniref:ankyrin repeat domain-containing protein n=1 Tax=Pseudomonas tolaasii TaxID=29442 RepID=UPI0027348F38|nr:ankyrin repeat domain-containing protein [Pseudomonas tolaasii]WLH54020.1 ankyrin repeat domain-containing protein [Pseudomonas tolaasii]